VVDASVALKWVLDEPDSHLAHALAAGSEPLLMPDFWLAEATNVLWLQVRRRIFTADEAREGLALLRALVPPAPTGPMALHEVAWRSVSRPITRPTTRSIWRSRSPWAHAASSSPTVPSSATCDAIPIRRCWR
jgi:hypothetical protein